jgi:hypothetical protein
LAKISFEVTTNELQFLTLNTPLPLLDNDIYCGVCLKVVTAPERPTLITDTTIIMGSGDADTKDSCPKCGGKVLLVF